MGMFNEYEYCMMQTDVEDGEECLIGEWGTLSCARDHVADWTRYEEKDMEQGAELWHTYRVVKRRKAGPVEDV